MNEVTIQVDNEKQVLESEQLQRAIHLANYIGRELIANNQYEFPDNPLISRQAQDAANGAAYALFLGLLRAGLGDEVRILTEFMDTPQRVDRQQLMRIDKQYHL